MLVAGGNGGFAKLTAPLEGYNNPARTLVLTLTQVVVFVDKIARCTARSSFPHKNRDTQSRRAIWVEEDKGLKLHPYRKKKS